MILKPSEDEEAAGKEEEEVIRAAIPGELACGETHTYKAPAPRESDWLDIDEGQILDVGWNITMDDGGGPRGDPTFPRRAPR